MRRYSGHRGPEILVDNAAAARVAKQAQAYIEAHYRVTVSCEELYRETGASVRTLQRCFREYFSLTVSDYLKTLRLDAASPSLTSVAAIDLRDGKRPPRKVLR